MKLFKCPENRCSHSTGALKSAPNPLHFKAMHFCTDSLQQCHAANAEALPTAPAPAGTVQCSGISMSATTLILCTALECHSMATWHSE